MIKREEDIQDWIYQVVMIPVEEDAGVGLELDEWGKDGWECFSVTVDKNDNKTLYFKKPRVYT